MSTVLTSVDTRNVTAVASAVRSLFKGMYPKIEPRWLERLFRDTEAIFVGRHPDYLPCDMKYHDLEHTLQVTLCFTRLMSTRHRSDAAPVITPRQFELGLAAALLHDVGYLKLRSDTQGTGAKYTSSHVLRGCAFASGYLPTLGANGIEVQGVVGAIRCTGPTSEVARMYFRNNGEKTVGCALATADYLSQLAAPDYPDELEILYHEFKESDDFVHASDDERAFKSAADLIEKTPLFWTAVVRPKLETSFLALYRFLADPYPHGQNAYLDGIERNIAKIKRRIGSGRKKK